MQALPEIQIPGGLCQIGESSGEHLPKVRFLLMLEVAQTPRELIPIRNENTQKRSKNLN